LVSFERSDYAPGASLDIPKRKDLGDPWEIHVAKPDRTPLAEVTKPLSGSAEPKATIYWTEEERVVVHPMSMVGHQVLGVGYPDPTPIPTKIYFAIDRPTHTPTPSE